MIFRKFMVVSLLILVTVTSISAQNDVLKLIDTADLKRHLSFIASDDLQGRRLGTEIEGLGIAANYLAAHAKQIGLTPGADGYFQDIGLVRKIPVKNAFVKVARKGKPVFESNKLIKIAGEPGIFQTKNQKIVFVGFGTGDLVKDDLEGKIVVVAQGNRALFGERKWEKAGWDNRSEWMKIEQLSMANPKAILIIQLPNLEAPRLFENCNRWLNKEQFIVKETNHTETTVLVASPGFGDAIAGGKKGAYKKFLVDYAKGRKSKTFATQNIRLELKAGAALIASDTKNVIGYIEGSDSILKNECVVFMAHYDHIGVAENGEVFNGADDNGSGTVTLMEVAEAFAGLNSKPKRSVVFLWVTFEEMGMFGSAYYTENPLFALEKTKLCINIDMDGRVYEPRDSVWKHSPKMVKNFDGLYVLSNKVCPAIDTISNLKCNELGLVPDKSLPTRFLTNSDHYHFYKNNVPVLNYTTGYHADFHKTGDEVSKINFEKIKRVADLCFLVGYEVANGDSTRVGSGM